MACGLGAFSVAIFHLLAHGCYKAFFFLSTGNALRSVEPGHSHSDHEHHVSEGMGTLYVGALLLALIPPFVIFLDRMNICGEGPGLFLPRSDSKSLA